MQNKHQSKEKYKKQRIKGTNEPNYNHNNKKWGNSGNTFTTKELPSSDVKSLSGHPDMSKLMTILQQLAHQTCQVNKVNHNIITWSIYCIMEGLQIRRVTKGLEGLQIRWVLTGPLTLSRLSFTPRTKSAQTKSNIKTET